MFDHTRNLKFIFFALVLLFKGQGLAAYSADDQLKHLSVSERVSVKNFFATAMRFEQLGHVLFFPHKPACLIAMRLTGGNISLDEKAFLNGWITWKKNEHLFPHPNFIVCAEIANFKCPEKFLHVYIVNKRTLVDCLSHYEAFFKETLGEHFSKEAFVEELEKTKKFSSLIKDDDALRGILLGFDKMSALAFKQVIARQFENYCREQYQRINCELGEKHLTHPVVFMGNPETKEVQDLMRTYASELDPIQEIYCKKDLLNLVLAALSTP